MAEVREFLLPDLGEGLPGAEIVRWLVEVGDAVVVDQPVVEVETAKAQVEVPCPWAGVITARHGAEGEEVPVGAPLVAVAVEVAPGAAPGPAPATAPTEGPGADTDASRGGSGRVLVGYGTADPAARDGSGGRRARRSRAFALVGAATADGTGPAGSPNGSRPAPARPLDPPAPRGNGAGPAVISPLVRRLARERGIDLTRLRGTGPDGLILRADVERAATRPRATPAPDADRPPAAPAPERAGETRIPLRGLLGTMADHLTRSRAEIPDATCWVDADATALVELRRELGEPRVPLLALLARICTAVLARRPELNATVDTERREIVRLSSVHLGLAAQTPRGLVVPVVRDAHTLTTGGLATEIARLTEAARAGTLPPAQLTGGTFTLNNYGVFGVDGSTPIINHPQAAMLGVGRIVEKPWAHNGEIALRHVVQLSLTFDHRVCDGAAAGGFLRDVADRVERPGLLLRDL